MKAVSFPTVLFLFSLFLHYCRCNKFPIVVVRVINGNEIKLIGEEVTLHAYNDVELVLGSKYDTKVTATVKYYTADHQESYKYTEIIDTGKYFFIPKIAAGTKVHVHFEPEDPTTYEMFTSVVKIDFEPYPIDSIIPAGEQAAVAQQLAISGKIIEITRNL